MRMIKYDPKEFNQQCHKTAQALGEVARILEEQWNRDIVAAFEGLAAAGLRASKSRRHIGGAR